LSIWLVDFAPRKIDRGYAAGLCGIRPFWECKSTFQLPALTGGILDWARG